MNIPMLRSLDSPRGLFSFLRLCRYGLSSISLCLTWSRMSSIVNYDHESGIPVVDFGPFRDGTRKQEIADAILRSFKEVGVRSI